MMYSQVMVILGGDNATFPWQKKNKGLTGDLWVPQQEGLATSLPPWPRTVTLKHSLVLHPVEVTRGCFNGKTKPSDCKGRDATSWTDHLPRIDCQADLGTASMKKRNKCRSRKKQISSTGYIQTQAAFIQLNNIETEQWNVSNLLKAYLLPVHFQVQGSLSFFHSLTQSTRCARDMKPKGRNYLQSRQHFFAGLDPYL